MTDLENSTHSQSSRKNPNENVSNQSAPHGAGSNTGAIALLMDIFGRLRARAQNGVTADLNVERNVREKGDKTEPSFLARASLGAVLSELDERAYGLLLLLLALPCCLPFIYILPQIVALPMLALSAQLAMGRASPWLPKKLATRDFAIDDFEHVLTRASKYIGWFERIAHPRLPFVTNKIGSRVVGTILLIPCASILVPLPTTNTLPGIGVTIASIGLIERDGLMVITGLFIGLIWVALLLFLGLEASSIIKGLILGG